MGIEQQKMWYLENFSEFSEVNSLPLPDKYDANESLRTLEVNLDNDENLVCKLASSLGVQIASIYEAAFALTLSKFSCEDKTFFISLDRESGEDAPLSVDFAKFDKVGDLIKHVNAQKSKFLELDARSIDDLAKELDLQNNISFEYHACANVENQKKDKKEFCFEIFCEDNLHIAKCIYQGNLYSETLIANFIESFSTILTGVLSCEYLKDIQIASKEQIAKLDSIVPTDYERSHWNACIIELFKQSVAKYPDINAVVYKDRSYTFKELDELTDKLASVILDNVKDWDSDDRAVVSILISRSENMVICPLAALKAGCAYQPLDPAYPKQRLNFMVKDANAALLISESQYDDLLDEYEGKRISCDDFKSIFSQSQSEVNLPASSPEDAFVLLYTSGSTGTPKGVILEHRNVATWCDWYKDYLKLGSGENVACYASFGFDAHMSDIYPALTTGLTVHIIPEEIRLDLNALNNYFVKNNIRSTLLTTALGTQFATNIEDTSLTYLITGGEKLAEIDPPKKYTLINAYGPSETTITVTSKQVKSREPNIPIGRNNFTSKLYVVDKQFRRLPIGAPGELIVAGPQVARGYLNRPDKTAECFLEDPFYESNNKLFKRAYRTGDIVRFRDNGDIEFVGRKDSQVKINGFRIELKEIESVILQHPDIDDVTVQDFDERSGGKFIAAYICSKVRLDVDELKAFIADRKPAYMVPKVVMQIDSIPHNVNQKVDKRALPEPIVRVKSSSSKDVPLNALELELSELIAEIIGTKDFGVGDELAYFGLTSINSIKLATKLYNKYSITINALDLLDGATLQSIENKILEMWMSAGGNSNQIQQDEVCERQSVNTSSHLNFSQLGVYAECLANPQSTFYNISYSIKVPKSIGTGKLRQAILSLIDAHPALRSHISVDSSDNAILCEDENFVSDVSCLEMSESEFAEHKKNFVNPFDLENEGLSTFEIVSTQENLYLLTSMHHLICDGASLDIILQDLCHLLCGERIENEKYSCYDFANDEKLDEKNVEFFDYIMQDYENATSLIPDVYGSDDSHAEDIMEVESDLEAIEKSALAQGVTPASIYLAATFLAASRFTFDDQVTIATISSGRSDVRIDRTVGMFVNTLPLNIKIKKDETCKDFVLRTAELFADVIRHEKHPFAQIAQRYDFKPQISFAYQVGVLEEYATDGGTLECEDLGADRAKLPISIQIFGDEITGAKIQVYYDTSLFSESFAKRFAQSIGNIASQLTCLENVGDISLVDEKDLVTLDSFNQTMRLDYDETDSVVSKFRKIVSEFPNKVAAIYKDKTYTYAQLDTVTDRLAFCISERLKRSVGMSDLKDVIVAALIDRSEYVFLLPLAILKSGAAYEPLDSSYPVSRLNFMVSDADAKLLIAQDDLNGLVDEYDGEVLTLSELESEEEKLGEFNLEGEIAPDNLMCILYTSGSTGKPKGCQIEHKNMIPFAYGSNMEGFYERDGVTASFASFGFDVCMADTFCTLLNGATLVVIPEDIRMNLDLLANYFNEMKVTQVLLTTQVGVSFVQNYPKMDTLKYLVMGGEKLPALDPSALTYTIINGYGPTENCCGVSLFPIKAWEENIPIGKPLQTIAGYVLDKSNHRLPPGAAGELCVSGPQVTRGYLNRPDKTKEAYENCPFNEFRMYHTGDVVRYRENGDIEFVGRSDGQVKIRGFRVEVKEVEAALREFPSIKDATVVAYSFDNGGKYLAGFVVSQEHIDIEDLKRFVAERKPAYMVPASLQQIDEIPLTVNSKVDVKALPKPKVEQSQYVEPTGEIETDLSSIFSEVLGVEKVGATSDFFELGGSSITAMKVIVAASKLDYDIVYQNIFDYSTPRALAQFLGDEVRDEANLISQSFESQTLNSITESIPVIGPDGYDYTRINALLKGNCIEAFDKGEKQNLENVVLFGATGYLGCHVLRELLDIDVDNVTCVVRSIAGRQACDRLAEISNFYFGDGWFENNKKRITIVEGDATKELTSLDVDNATVINCAASVKHFAADGSIEKNNLGSVRNIIDWCLSHNSRLVHVSTESVFGHPYNGVPSKNFTYDETMLYVGQVYEDNQYVRSKFLAERLIYENIIDNCLNAKVLRAGNLAPRQVDGKFQINAQSNNFMNTLKGLSMLGCIPYEMADSESEFSPIDTCAKALCKLAITPKKCVCFHMSNNHRLLLGDIVDALNGLGENIEFVEGQKFASALSAALDDESKSEMMAPFLAYATNEGDGGEVEFDLAALKVSYSAQVLSRLGLRWPICGSSYVKRFWHN